MAKANEIDYSLLRSIFHSHITEAEAVEELTKDAVKGAEAGRELENISWEDWLHNRFEYQLVWLDRDDYLRALVRALWLGPKFAGTDFGSSRQRDLAQVWTDTARGFLGEIAVSKFLEKTFGIETLEDSRRGQIEDFLQSDIVQIRMKNQGWRDPNLQISIKTTKLNGRWLDVPGDQISHSDVFILVKAGIRRTHFLSFLKAVSFLRDKLFPNAKALGEINSDEAELLWNEIPQFSPIPAYIAGFLDKTGLDLEKEPIQKIDYHIVKGKNRRVKIASGIGLFSPETVRDYLKTKNPNLPGELEVEIDPIIKKLAGKHFLANSGGLLWGQSSWRSLIARL
ncbi:hypothetical protein [Coprothermobacter proteolyticus]|uniref:hypothetical protein n=1 Tax=Coprothermobacter proteolyticus TaxID=35786 RepID=UPI000D2FD1BC|nr:hypothetical protein [Coprothermobacter proteolyticus]